ncbi:MAG: hypothetical protein RL380_390 [Verrucomicrobiota bacterium]
MKTKTVRLWLLALGVSALVGCAADTNSTDNSPAVPPLFQPAPVAVAEPQPLPPSPPAAPVTPPAVSRNVADIAQLAKSGVSEKLMLTFVQNTRTPFALGATEIIYLNDVGVSETVLDAMLRHDRELGVATSEQPASAAAVIVEQPTAPEPTTIVVVQEPAPVTVNYFYENLSPYGSWIEVEEYGRCWQPAVVVQQPGWRPYCDRGHWSYTSRGWYWESDYSWGATFHYGRWFHHARRGWCWIPDTNWGPAWVSWRDSSDYCGWAPLPPTACYRPGVGFTYRNENVSVSFGFGLGADCYTFVPRNRFGNGRPQSHALPVAQNSQVINNTTVINNYVTGNNNTVINQGITTTANATAPAQAAGLAPHFANPRGRTPVVRQPATAATATTSFAPAPTSAAPAVAPVAVAPAAPAPLIPSGKNPNPRLPNWPSVRPSQPVRATPSVENQNLAPVKASPTPIRYQNLAPVRQPQPFVQPSAPAVAQPVVRPATPAVVAAQNWQAAAENFRQQHPQMNLPTRNFTPAAPSYTPPVAQPAPVVRAQPQPQAAPVYQAPVRSQPAPQVAPQAAPPIQQATPARSQPHNAEEIRAAVADAIERAKTGRH